MTTAMRPQAAAVTGLAAPGGGMERAGEFLETFGKLKAGIGATIVGHDRVVEQMLICLFTGGHALIEGLPGLGKTRMVQSLCGCLGVGMARIQFTPDLMPADIIGSDVIADLESGRALRFQPGPVFGQVLLADEINRATPKTQSALLEAMQEHAVTVGGTRHPLPRPFFVLATQNPIEIDGTYPLPEAQIDRFMLKLSVGAPAAEEIAEIIDRTTGREEPAGAQVTDIDHVESLKLLVRDVLVPREVKEHVARLVLATHPETEGAPPSVRRFVRYGASPRGARALVLAGKVGALLDGRFNVSLQDVEAMVPPALRHRVILNFEAEAEGIATDTILDDVVRQGE